MDAANRRGYQTDVTDEEWAFVAPYLALCHEDAAQRDYPLREVFNGLRYIVKTGNQWRLMPHDLPPLTHLAQARSNRGPRGRKTDFRDAMRIVNRLLTGELILSFVPNMEQRCWRTLTRSRYQLRQDQVRIQNQLECLLEEVQIKLSSLQSDLLGQSGRRILRAMADSVTDSALLASLARGRLRATREELQDTLCGRLLPLHRQVLSLYLERLDLIERQMESLERSVAQALKAHQDSVTRLVEIPGVGVLSSTGHCRGWSSCRGISLHRTTSILGRRLPRQARNLLQ
jgi:transposase